MISPTLYARVVEKVPEASVCCTTDDGSVWCVEVRGNTWLWNNPPFTPTEVISPHLQALILRHWLVMLPQGYGLERTAHKDGWCVVYFGHEAESETEVMPTPEEALAEWLLNRSGK